MIRKKGFTLTELIAAIVILGILATLAVISIARIISSSKQKSLASTISTIRKSALINLMSDNKDIGFYKLNDLVSNDNLNSPNGGYLTGYVIIDCLENDKCDVKDYIFEKIGDTYKKIMDDGTLNEEESQNIGMININEIENYNDIPKMKEYGYIDLRVEGNDYDLYNSYYILKKDGSIKKIPSDKKLVINAEYYYDTGNDEKIKVLVLANDGEEATLLIMDDTEYGILDIENRIKYIQDNYGINDMNLIDINDLRIRGDDEVYQNVDIDEEITNVNGFRGLIGSSNNYWVANNNCLGHEENFCMLVIQNDGNNKFYLKDDAALVATSKARLGIKFKTKKYDKILSLD